MSTNTEQICSSVATNLAFGLGPDGPFVAAGLSVFFGLFSSGGNDLQDIAKTILNAIDNAVSDLEAYQQQSEISDASVAAEAFFTQLKRYSTANDNSVPTLTTCVDSLWTQFSAPLTTLVTETETVAGQDFLKLGAYAEFDTDSVVHVLMSLLTAQIAARKAIMLSAKTIFDQIGPGSTADGMSSNSVEDDTASQIYLQRGLDAFKDLSNFVFGDKGPRGEWTELISDVNNPVCSIFPGQYLPSPNGKFYCCICEDGSAAVFAGSGPDDCQGLSWKSPCVSASPTYLWPDYQGNLQINIVSDSSKTSPDQDTTVWKAASFASAPPLPPISAPPPHWMGTPVLVMQDDGQLTLLDGNDLLWSNFIQSSMNPYPGVTDNFIDSELSIFDPKNPDLGLLIDRWPTLYETFQPVYWNTVNNTSYNPWQNSPDCGSMPEFAAQYGWGEAVRQLMTFRKIARLIALSPIGTYNSRSCSQLYDERGNMSYICTGYSGYQYTDSANPSANYSHNDDYDDDHTVQTPTCQYLADVESHWINYWPVVKAQLLDVDLWDTYSKLTRDWESKVLELGGFVCADAPANELSVTAWGPALSDPGSWWNLCITVSYALSYEVESGSGGLRSDFFPAVAVNGANPTLTGFPSPPAGVTKIYIWRKFIAKGAPSTMFEVPQRLTSVSPGITTWTDSDMGAPR